MTASRKSTLILTIIAIVCIIIMTIVIVSNVNGLSNSIEKRTYNYLRDVARQSAQVIEERLKGLVNSLRIIGDSLAHRSMDDREASEEFLRRKISISEFDALAYVDLNGYSVMVDQDGNFSTTENILDSYSDSEALAATLNGQSTAGFYDDYIAFMDPIYDGDTVMGAIIGVRLKSRLEKMLVNDAFEGTGFTFIIDQYGDILVQPMDEEVEGLAVFLEDAVDNFSAQAQVMEDQGEPINSIEITLESGSGASFLLDYQALDIFDWAVVTMVDEDFLAHDVNSYVMRIILTLIVLMVVFMVMFIIMILMQSRYQKRLESMAFIDPLTGGISFIRFRMLAQPLIQKEGQGAYALVTLNVKRFKMINRLGGSLEGDELLRSIYHVLEKNLVDEDEIAAHNTADNFLMLLRNDGEKKLRERLENIARQIGNISTVLPVHTSQGVYAATDPDIDMIVFLDRANLARISQSDDYHSTCVFYDDDFVKQQEERVRMIGMIENGLQKNEFTVFLQPKVSPAKDKVVGAEALVRWIHPEQGMIGPNIFIPLCEQNGLICALDEYVFEKVCIQMAAWREKGWDPGIISVNVSGLHLKDVEFLKVYRGIADKHGVDPGKIEMELTESIMFSDSEIMEARSVLDAIHDFGFRCSMDDFGSGYSALGLLQELPIDCIKLDRSFFIDCIDNPRAQIVIDMIIELAKRLKITTVAEGIESAQQVQMLKNMGCDMIQGFYFSPPLPMEQYAEMVFVKHEIYNPKGTSGKAR